MPNSRTGEDYLDKGKKKKKSLWDDMKKIKQTLKKKTKEKNKYLDMLNQ
tara:strand:- start:254 stop:400 length:147 start_codon:yes stop_codon:yes gene_type:complete